MEKHPEMPLRSIGRVQNAIGRMMRHGWSEIESELVIDSALTDSLDGLEGFTHIIVIFWMHKSTRPYSPKVHPQGRSDMPLTGLFATRAPHRPNNIGLTVVELLERNGNSLKVRGLDAIDGTPLIDIKPYLPRDTILQARYPEWVSRLSYT